MQTENTPQGMKRDEPYFVGAYDYLKQGVAWAQKYGINVVGTTVLVLIPRFYLNLVSRSSMYTVCQARKMASTIPVTQGQRCGTRLKTTISDQSNVCGNSRRTSLAEENTVEQLRRYSL